MPADPRRVKDLFVAALDLPDRPARAALLDRECAGDPDLRHRVDVLLAAHEQPESALERPLAVEPATAAFQPRTEAVGTVIAGKYKLLEPIGEGGMGEVWVADQLEPIRRRVALKVIKAGMDSRSVLARFEAERQALALMDHPNIARVLDAGATADGRPFFVMELVKGTPITEFCDARKLTPRERLELFIPVCQAIQHAHQKGIIHRDIKPSNVLVALHDEHPVPKVIDFGVAKAVGQQLTEKTLYTGFGALIGTPAYMAPEQATFNQLDVDTRADVYALGVLLYELLAGSPPFEPERLKKAALDEVLRLVREEEPQRPSARLSTSQMRASIAASRQTDPDKLTRLVRGELDWLIMKALEKDRNRRYETAAAFAQDVRRYLAGEPVAAVPPSPGYRLRKFVRRNRGPVAAGALVFLALAGGVVGTSVGLVRADAERRRAVAAEVSERAERQKADAARRAAEQTAAGLQVDLDLEEVRKDSRVGLLRLARTLKSLPAGASVLREFATVAVLAVGQKYAPLVPPITHDGRRVGRHHLSPDARTLLTLGADHTARLWETRTARPLAVLRRGGERVVACALSPDGKTVVTDSQDGALRFWDVPSGALRAETEPRPDRYGQALPQNGPLEYSDLPPSSWLPTDSLRVAGDRALTGRYAAAKSAAGWARGGPVELWNTTTGRRVARLDRPGLDCDSFDFVGDGRWVTAVEGRAAVVVFSADDGREVGRLTHPGLGPRDYVGAVSGPTGRRIVTQVFSPTGRRIETEDGSRDEWTPPRFYTWEAGTWRRFPGVIAGGARGLITEPGRSNVHHIGDDRFVIPALYGGWLVYRPGRAEPLARVVNEVEPDGLVGEIVHDGDGNLFDVWSGQRLLPPAGRRFHPDLARFAPDGRFVARRVLKELRLIDTWTDKALETAGFFDASSTFDGGPLRPLPGFGLCGIVSGAEFVDQVFEAQVLLIPTTSPAIPPGLLELWAQVAARGEIGPDGGFAKWDEPTWERKWQELAAQAAPSPDSPFPGHVATDRLHWVRGEFEGAQEADRRRLAEQLLRRAEELGDRAEAVRWRAVLEARPAPVEAAPPPRVMN